MRASRARIARELLVFLRLWAATASNDEPGLRSLFTERDRFFRAYFEDAIIEGQAEGSVRGDLDPADTAIALIGLIRGIAMQALYDRRVADDERVRRTAVALLERGLSPLRRGQA